MRNFRFSEASGDGLRRFRISARERTRKIRCSELLADGNRKAPGDGDTKFSFVVRPQGTTLEKPQGTAIQKKLFFTFMYVYIYIYTDRYRPFFADPDL